MTYLKYIQVLDKSKIKEMKMYNTPCESISSNFFTLQETARGLINNFVRMKCILFK